jgi:hypothetical protein
LFDRLLPAMEQFKYTLNPPMEIHMKRDNLSKSQKISRSAMLFPYVHCVIRGNNLLSKTQGNVGGTFTTNSQVKGFTGAGEMLAGPSRFCLFTSVARFPRRRTHAGGCEEVSAESKQYQTSVNRLSKDHNRRGVCQILKISAQTRTVNSHFADHHKRGCSRTFSYFANFTGMRTAKKNCQICFLQRLGLLGIAYPSANQAAAIHEQC